MTRPRGDERGSSDVAAMIVIVPIVMGFVVLMMFWGRQSEAAQHVTHAATVGARAGALARNRADAVTAATNAVTATLASATTACAGGPQVTVTATAWAPGGVVTVTVDCDVATGDLAPITPPARRYQGSAQAVIDRFRGYQP